MKRSKFSLSNYKLLTGDMGELLPVGLTEVLPGDTIQQATSALIRVSPLMAPVMHPVQVRIHHWFVPHRMVWEDFENFITGGPDGNDASVFPTITIGAGGVSIGDLGDYLGVPVDVDNIEVSALPFRGYARIWNEYYRDQDLQNKAIISLASGADITTSTALKKVCWEKDYFTTSRPWTQKGDEISLPLGTTAPVVSDGTPIHLAGSTQGTSRHVQSGVNGGPFTGLELEAMDVWENLKFGTGTGLEADLTNATASTVNQLREAFALQRYKEARARYGSRYTEYLRYLGVKSSDARLDRPEYLGGGRQTIQFSEVLQTGVTTDGDDTAGVGNLRGHGIGALRSNRFRKFFEEHGYVFTFMSVLPKTMYAQGLARHWNRRSKEDFFQKELQFIGQQEVLNKEIYAAHADPDDPFGYQDRYDEYRRTESSIAGDFRDTLDHWHMARIFAGEPTLNDSFVTADPTKRIHAVTTEDVLWIMANHSIQARRMVAANE